MLVVFIDVVYFFGDVFGVELVFDVVVEIELGLFVV